MKKIVKFEQLIGVIQKGQLPRFLRDLWDLEESAGSDGGTTSSHINDTDNPHQVTKSQVGLGDVPNLDTSNAINKAHDQNTDTKLAEGTSDEVSASELRNYIDNEAIHTERSQILAINWFNS